MQCEILMIGTELLLGQIVDTNAAFMGQTLAEHGINLYQKTTVGDNPERIRNAFDDALRRSDVVLTSGGLGPTEDDITRECIADLLDRPLEFRQDLYDELAARFERFRFAMTENNRKQATAPRGAISIPNPNGTAPGLIVEDARGTIICMPGVPHELKAMLTDSVLPYLKKKFGIAAVIHSRVLKVCGIGESRVDAAIGDLIKHQQNPTVGVLASPDAVRIRITARAATRDEACALIGEVDARVRERLPGLIMGVDDETLEQVVDGLLRARGWRIALAESVTGGALARRMAAAGVPSFAGGMVLPCAALSQDDTARAAAELAAQARAQYGAECALGIAANPSARQTAVHFASPEGGITWDMTYWGTDDRSQVRTSIFALENVRRHLAGVTYP